MVLPSVGILEYGTNLVFLNSFSLSNLRCPTIMAEGYLHLNFYVKIATADRIPPLDQVCVQDWRNGKELDMCKVHIHSERDRKQINHCDMWWRGEFKYSQGIEGKASEGQRMLSGKGLVRRVFLSKG